MKQRLFVYFFLFLFASILNSCNKGNEDVRFISRYENLNPIVAKAAQWYDSQELIMDFIDNKSPAWNNAVIKKTPDGFPLIVVQIYSKRIPRGSASGSKRKSLRNGWFFITFWKSVDLVYG